MKKVAGRLKLELSQYRDLEAFAQFGSDLDPETQRTLARGERLVKTLNQGEGQPMPVEEQVAVIYAATNGYVDRIAADRVEDFQEKLVERLHSGAGDALKKIADGDWGEDVQKSLEGVIKEFAEDFGYDLDEEGQPLSDEDEDAATSRSRSKGDDDSEERSDDNDDESSEQEEEKAGAAA
jgi:F-type H+-transporting ATPase subunit alpha